jgi:hypothetical protein
MIGSTPRPSDRYPLFAEVQGSEDCTVTLAAIARELPLDTSSAPRWVTEAGERGYLLDLEQKRGRPAKIALREPMPAHVVVLPDVSLLAEHCSEVCSIVRVNG